ncbi:hypothetical protein F4Y93_06460 [Candidatus Poribacteria bacterium]|nr:hypothetical protein [Candidatus Poribacteria bacterium]
MNIDILAAPHFHNCQIDAPRGIHNSGGGMSVLIDSIRACLMGHYAIRLCDDFSELSAPVCFAETCFFTSDINDADYWGAVHQIMATL